MSYLPLSIIAFFLLTVSVGLFLLTMTVIKNRIVTFGILVWICVQSAIALSGFYSGTNSFPPRLALAIAPPLLVIGAIIFTTVGRRFLDSMDLKWCVLFHSIRILVEINLYWLFLYKQVPALMTFEAGNVDIVAGLTAPLIGWAFSKGRIGSRGLIIWNGVALLSVLNALVRAMLSAPFRFQRIGFDQPTVAIFHFPFVLLPAFLVPAVLLCHAAIFVNRMQDIHNK